MPGKSAPRFAPITCSSGTNCVRASGTGTQRGRLFGTFTRAKCTVPRSGSRTSTASDSERLEMYGNGWPGIDRERRQNREHLRLEVLVDRAPLARRELVDVDEAHAVRARAPASSSRAGSRLPRLEQLRHALANRVELLGGVSPSGVRVHDTPAPTCRRRPADAHHEELVEVRAEDREELQALEQRHARSIASCSTRALNSSQLSSRFR